MTCADARKLLSELSLGDLDAEPAREVGLHLEACADCRAVRGTLDRAVRALGAPAPLAPSTERREAAVLAMGRARATPATSKSARRLFAAAAAAALLLVAGALFLARPVPGLRASEVWGRADLYRASTGAWTPLAPGDAVGRGDRVVTHGSAGARLSAPGLEVWLDASTGVGVTPDGRLSLERGRLFAEGTGSVIDTANNAATFGSGRIEASLREARGRVAGAREEKGGSSELPAARDLVSDRLLVRVADGTADLSGSHLQRLRAEAGQEGTFDLGGRPSTGPLADPSPGAWRRR
jgi:hypothetical protein